MSRSASLAETSSPLAATPTGGPQIATGLTVGYLILLAAGFVWLRLPGATVAGNEMNVQRAVFTAVNAGTLTGFQQAVPLDDYGASGKACVLTLTVGGMLFSFLVGGLALVRIAKLPYTDGQVISATLFTVVFATGCGTAMLLEPSRGILASVTQALSALGNSGLALGKLPGVTDARTHFALLPLAVAGGLSIPVLMELADAVFKRQKLSNHTRTVLTLSALVYLLGLLLLAPWFTPKPQTSLAIGSALSLDSRSAGFALLPIGSIIRPVQWLLIVWMIIGAAPGGSAGGIKVTSLYHVFRAARLLLTGQTPGRIAGVAIVWVSAYLLLTLLTLIGLLATLPELPADRAAFLAVSAVGNVGLSHDPVSFAGGAMYVLSSAMLLGKLAPLCVLWWCAMLSNEREVAVG